MAGVSVIVCTTGRIAPLLELMQSLAAQTVPPREVLVIDQSGSDALSRCLNGLPGSFPIGHLPASIRSLTRGRNIGIESADPTSEWLLFLDDDVVLSPSYLQQLLLGVERHREARVVFGAIGNLWETPPLYNRLARLAGLPFHGPGAGFGIMASFKKTMDTQPRSDMLADWATGCGFMVERTVFADVRFDANLEGYSFNEDTDFSLRVRAVYPDSIWCIPAAVLSHLRSPLNRLGRKELTHMRTLYEIYLHGKHTRPGLSTCRFVLGETAYALLIAAASLVRHPLAPYSFWWHVCSYACAWKYRRDLARGDLRRVNEFLRRLRGNGV